MAWEDEVRAILRSARPAAQAGCNINVRGDGNVVSGGPVIFSTPAKASAEDLPAESSRTCPQCKKGTWRATRNCMHCDLDLFRHDAREESEQIRNRWLWISTCLAIAGVLCIVLGNTELVAAHLVAYGWMVTLLWMACFWFSFQALHAAQRLREDAKRYLV